MASLIVALIVGAVTFVFNLGVTAGIVQASFRYADDGAEPRSGVGVAVVNLFALLLILAMLGNTVIVLRGRL